MLVFFVYSVVRSCQRIQRIKHISTSTFHRLGGRLWMSPSRGCRLSKAFCALDPYSEKAIDFHLCRLIPGG